MLTYAERDKLYERIRDAWGADITPEMLEDMRVGEVRLLQSMRISLLDTLHPTKIIAMIDGGQVVALGAKALQCETRMKLLDELRDAMRGHFGPPIY